VKILIEMTPEHYNDLLAKCRNACSKESDILNHETFPLRWEIAGKKQPRIGILCEKHQAHSLFVLARSLRSPAFEDIKKALDTILHDR
jgi:hypothetical protein